MWVGRNGIFVLAVALACGCGDSRGGGRDSGPPGVDAGHTPGIDSGPHDGGSVDSGSPIGFGTDYTPCFANIDCDSNQCIYVEIPSLETLGRFCTVACTSNSDCRTVFGFSGACYSLPPSPLQYCYQHCNSGADCYEGNKCTMVQLTTGPADMICMPNNRASP